MKINSTISLKSKTLNKKKSNNREDNLRTVVALNPQKIARRVKLKWPMNPAKNFPPPRVKVMPILTSMTYLITKMMRICPTMKASKKLPRVSFCWIRLHSKSRLKAILKKMRTPRFRNFLLRLPCCNSNQDWLCKALRFLAARVN